MKHRKKLLLLASAACVVVGAGLSSQAMAFDEVNWEWNKLVTENVVKDVTVTIDNTPSGMVEIEKIQAHIGDVTATSTVSGVENNPPGVGEGGTVAFDEIITVTSNFNKPVGVGNSVPNASGLVNDDGDTPLTSTYLGGTLSEQANGFTVINDVQIEGEFELEDVEGVNDALDLPKVESIATAVGNNQTIDSDVSLELHDAQYLFGGFAAEDTAPNGGAAELLASALEATPDSGNTHTEVAGALTIAGALGLITPASVSATSTVSDILNASVDSDATAVGNNMDIELTAFTPDDALVIADLTQFSYADVSASSSVTDVTIDNYANLGEAGFGNCGGCLVGDVLAPQTPIVSSVATAVGNNMAISVSSPTVETP